MRLRCWMDEPPAYTLDIDVDTRLVLDCPAAVLSTDGSDRAAEPRRNEWLAECADGALVYVEAAHLRRLPMDQAGTGGTCAGFGTRAGNGQRGSEEALVAAAQEAYKACGDWRKGPMVAAMRSSGREAGRVSEREMAEAVKEAHRRWRGGPPTLRSTTAGSSHG